MSKVSLVRERQGGEHTGTVEAKTPSYLLEIWHQRIQMGLWRGEDRSCSSRKQLDLNTCPPFLSLPLPSLFLHLPLFLPILEIKDRSSHKPCNHPTHEQHPQPLGYPTNSVKLASDLWPLQLQEGLRITCLKVICICEFVRPGTIRLWHPFVAKHN